MAYRTTSWKNTDIGKIPSDWECGELGKMGSFISGVGFAESEQGGKSGIPFYKVSDMNLPGNEVYMQVANNYVTQEQIDRLRYKTITNRAIIFAKVGAAIFLERKRIAKDFLIDNNMMAFVPNDGVAFLKIQLDKIKFSEYTKVGALPSYNASDLQKIKIVLPQASEQQKIAEVLTDLDDLIAELEKVRDKKQAIKIGAMQELLTGKRRLPGFNKPWKEVELGEIGVFTGAGVDKKTNPEESRVRLLNFLDVYKRDFIYSSEIDCWSTASEAKISQCDIRKGDVFFTPSSETPYDIALSAVAMEDITNAVYSYHINRFRINEDWDIRFRTYIFKTRAFYNQAETLCEGSGTRYVISLSKFRKFVVKVPTEKAEQTAIANILSDMDDEISAINDKINKYKQIKAGVADELLSGRIRLIKPQE